MQRQRLHSILAALLAFFLVGATAWPWPHFVEEKIHGVLQARQQQQSNSTSGSTLGPTSTSGGATMTGSLLGTITPAPTNSGNSNSNNNNNSNGTTTVQANSTLPQNTSSVLINPVDPPGGVQMLTPAPISGVQYYRVGDYVTFAWNYTSLLVTPTAVDVLASCSLNAQTYTLTANMSVQPTGAVTWDTGAMQLTASNPLPVASYTLIVHDSNQPVSAVPSAGYLGAYAQYVFGVYTGQPYVPLNEFKCATCSGALSTHEKQALSVLVGTTIITVISFSIFANGFGGFS